MTIEPKSDREQGADDSPASTSTTHERATHEAQLAALDRRYRQLAADFDNFRKRAARDAEQRAAEQKLAFIRELLPVVDNLERALASPRSTSAAEALRRGIEMTHRDLLQLLHRHGVDPDDPVGLPFDPYRHEAIQSRFDPAQGDHVILEVSQRGYFRGPDVIRPARVVVNDLSAGEGADDGD